MKTYTAQVGPDNAARLSMIISTKPDGPVIEDLGEGTVQVNDLDQLRSRAAEEDGSITDDEDGLQIWIDGEGYPLFDEVDAAVADALGAQTLYLEAKHNSDRAEETYARAIATVVGLAGSAQTAAQLLDMDEAEVTGFAAQVAPPEPVAPAEPVAAPEPVAPAE
jgi:hypothetical protein